MARIAWLVDGGADPGTITAVTFNKRAAEELTARLVAALPAGQAMVRVRTFHALGLEILRGAGEPVEPLVDREEVLRAVLPAAPLAELRRLDTVFSRLKLDLDVSIDDIEVDPEAGPVARAYVAYQRAIAATGGLDFDDLVARAVHVLERRADQRSAWRERCTHLLVDEAQDLDRMQLRLALLLAAPANRVFLVGDDDQSIYGWRLADVRRLLGLAGTSLPGLTRVDLQTNYRCPAVVIERALRLVEHNRERFAKVILPGPAATGRLVLAPSRADGTDAIVAVLRSWPADDSTRAILARTNRELLPAVAACLALEIPFTARDLELIVERPEVDAILDRVAGTAPNLPLLVRLSRAGADAELLGAVLGWAVPYADLEALRAAIVATRALLAVLRRDDAALSLATAHGTKGLEFDHVAVIGLEEGRFPSARSIADAEDPARALEEERRLAYVAWTRARRSLTLLFDPDAPSMFLREAFDDEELGLAA